MTANVKKLTDSHQKAEEEAKKAEEEATKSTEEAKKLQGHAVGMKQRATNYFKELQEAVKKQIEVQNCIKNGKDE